MTAAALRYHTDPAYREDKKAQAAKWNRRHKARRNARIRANRLIDRWFPR